MAAQYRTPSWYKDFHRSVSTGAKPPRRRQLSSSSGGGGGGVAREGSPHSDHSGDSHREEFSPVEFSPVEFSSGKVFYEANKR